MNGLTNILVECDWTDAMMASFSNKEINSMKTYCRGVTAVQERVENFMQSHGVEKISLAQISWLNQYANRKSRGAILSSCKLEETVWPNNGIAKYTEKEITVIIPDVEPIVMPLNPIPVKECRMHAPLISVLLTCAFSMRNGILKFCIKDKELSERFNLNGSRIQEGGVAAVAEVFFDLIKNTNTGKSAIKNQTTMNDVEWTGFVQQALKECPYVDYLAIHTAVALKWFKAYSVKNGKLIPYMYTDVHGKRLPLCGDSFMICDKHTWGKVPSEAIAVFKKAKGFSPIFWVKGIVSKKKMPSQSNAGTEEGLRAIAIGRSFSGGSKSMLSKLAGCEGFASFQSELTRDILLYITTARTLLLNGSEVDIECHAGMMPIIISSLRDIENCSMLLKFKVSYKAHGMASPSIKPYIVTAWRGSAIGVSIDRTSIPANNTKVVSTLLDDMATHHIGGLSQRFIHYCYVYSKVFFDDGRTVRLLRQPWDSFASVSTEKQVHLTPTEGVVVQLSAIKYSEWWKIVIAANGKLIDYLTAPKPFFSTLVNSVTLPAGATYSYDEVSDSYIPRLTDMFLDDGDNDEFVEEKDTISTISTIVAKEKQKDNDDDNPDASDDSDTDDSLKPFGGGEDEH